ncbi:MAG: FAD-dependent oxidoreductase [Actinobacteria bacterium]|nr:FAD-dependent oxidoreductase [Actinomycetota bacterium]
MSTIEPILKDRYEVIIVGTGIGGLTAGAVLAKEGIDVLLIEQAHQPGGCCTSFSVGGFTFDAAVSSVKGCGRFGFHILRTVFDFLNQQVELIPLESAYSMYFGEQRVDFYHDRLAFTSELGAMFPQSSGSILSFLRELDHLYHAVLDCSGPPRPAADQPASRRWSLLARHPLSLLRASRYKRISADQVFYRHLDDPLARSFFEADFIYNTGYNMLELSALNAAMVAMDRHSGGAHYPIGSSQQIPNRLEKSILENDGRVLYRTPVEEIMVEGGRATGVRTEGGRAIRAETVISNTSVRDLFGRLVAPEHLKPQTMEWVSSLEPTPSVMSIYLGVSNDVIPEDFNPITVLVDDPEREPGNFVSISIPSLLDPNLAPEGRHSVSIYSVTDPSIWPSPDDTTYGSGGYRRIKEEEGKKVLEKVENLLPGISEAAVEKLVASPATFERFTRREKGALAGPRLGPEPFPAALPGAVTEVKGLFLVGDSTFFGRGVAEAAASGLNGATATLRFLGLTPPGFHPEKGGFLLETVPVRPEISGEKVVDALSAVLESHRCLRCPDAPCSSGCPAGVDILTFIRRLGTSDFPGAARVIRESTPLGEVCGLVCPAGRLCESACRRAAVDTPVKISQLEAFTCSFVPEPEGWPEPFRGERGERVAVIGSGPAGISCAYYLSLLGYRVEVFEAAVEAGGLPAQVMPDSRLERQILEREIEGALRDGIEFRGNTTFGQDINLETLWREGFCAVFLGAGLGAMRLPGISGTDLPGVIDALSFLDAARRGVKRELTSRVAVLGEDDIAVEAALLAGALGAQKVFLVTSGTLDDLKANTNRAEELERLGVEILTERFPAELVWEERVSGVRTTAAGAPEDEVAELLEVGTVIMTAERGMSDSLARYLEGHLTLTPGGTVEVDEDTLMTSRAGVFAGGEIVSAKGTVVSACADGRRAALSIHRYLSSAPRAAEPAGEEAS